MDTIKIPLRKYWDWRSRTFGCDTDKVAGIEAAWEAALNGLLPAAKGKRALDVGTGLGQFAIYLARSGFEVTGIDFSEQMILHARQVAKAQNLQIQFDTGDAETLEFDDNIFDAVVSRNVLWTLPNPDKALSEWRRVIKPGGSVVVSDGYWKNTTLKRIHKMVYRSLKDIFQNASCRPLRFFLSYFHAQKQLPFYEGLNAADVDVMLKNAGFRRVDFCDTSVFATHPYRGDGSHVDRPVFFIAHASK